MTGVLGRCINYVGDLAGIGVVTKGGTAIARGGDGVAAGAFAKMLVFPYLYNPGFNWGRGADTRTQGRSGWRARAEADINATVGSGPVVMA